MERIGGILGVLIVLAGFYYVGIWHNESRCRKEYDEMMSRWSEHRDCGEILDDIDRWETFGLSCESLSE